MFENFRFNLLYLLKIIFKRNSTSNYRLIIEFSLILYKANIRQKLLFSQFCYIQ